MINEKGILREANEQFHREVVLFALFINEFVAKETESVTGPFWIPDGNSLHLLYQFIS